MKSLQVKQSTVVDITYLCNATCRYCRWGNDNTPQRYTRSLDDVLIPSETLKNLKTKRIVLSGGEPRLHPEIMQILDYYSNLVDQVILITNGYGLTKSKVEKLMHAGATGFTVSLDSIDSIESFLTRSTLPHIHKRILANIEDICTMQRNFEFSINCVVSHITANYTTVSKMLEFGNRLNVDFVKFQPIFDDGYASKNAPELLLTFQDAEPLLEIAAKLTDTKNPPTNDVGFWRDVATLASNGILHGSKCGLGPSHTILINDKLSMCYWISSQYGAMNSIDKKTILKTQADFEGKKSACNVDFHCFCNQEIDHVWST